MSTTTTTAEYDAVVIGAGLGGLRMLIELERLGLNYRCLDAASGVGGTWYWNRYPGARTDSESWTYCYQFDPALVQEWTWKDRFPGQAEVEAYLNHVADRYDVRKSVDFDTHVASAHYDESANIWTVTSDEGRTYTCKYLITAGGPLAAAYMPDFPGLESFAGDWYHTGRWPKEPVDFKGKRVGIIGTGATGVQIIPLVSQECDQLTVFQRTPNYVIPARNHPLSPTEQRARKAEHERIAAVVRQHWFGMDLGGAGRLAGDCTAEEHQSFLEWGWEVGGFHFIFETFDDIFLTDEANDIASEFVRNKIRSIVKDPATAEALCPAYPIAAKRIPLGHGYYEAFNRDNVELVDVAQAEIEAITESGVRLADGREFELDILIFATGFDASTGSLTRMDIRGRGGLTIADAWADGAQTHIGVATKRFPNLFMVFGPQTPFANFPPVAEDIVEWIGKALTHLEESDADVMEATQEAMDEWSAHLEVLLNATVLAKGEYVRSWFLGANIPGKPHKVLFHFGGVASFFESCRDVIDQDWKGFEFHQHVPAEATPV